VGPGLERQWEGERILRVGRSESFEVVLNDPSVSRRHAEIEFTEQGWVARDQGSSNGTFLNGVRVGRTDRLLRERDLLQCGNVVLAVEALTTDSLDLTETPCGGLQVQATARQSLEQAAELLALDVTRSTRPGEQLLHLLRAGQFLHPASSLDELLRPPRKNLGVLHLDRGPGDYPFTRDDLHLADALAANMSTAIESAQVFQEKQQHLFIQTVIAFSQAIEMRDQYTGGHTQRVTD